MRLAFPRLLFRSRCDAAVFLPRLAPRNVAENSRGRAFRETPGNDRALLRALFKFLRRLHLSSDITSKVMKRERESDGRGGTRQSWRSLRGRFPHRHFPWAGHWANHLRSCGGFHRLDAHKCEMHLALITRWFLQNTSTSSFWFCENF